VGDQESVIAVQETTVAHNRESIALLEREIAEQNERSGSLQEQIDEQNRRVADIDSRSAALQEELDIGRTALQRLNTETGRTGDWHNLARHLRPTGASPQAEPDFSNLYDEEGQILLMEAEWRQSDPAQPKKL
jgi:hypothetical protein